MSDNKLIKCQAERDEWRRRAEAAEKELEVSEDKRLRRARHQVKLLKVRVESLTNSLNRAITAKKQIQNDLDPLKEALHRKGSETQGLAVQLQEIRDTLTELNRPVTAGESITGKIREMQEVIDTKQGTIDILSERESSSPQRHREHREEID